MFGNKNKLSYTECKTSQAACVFTGEKRHSKYEKEKRQRQKRATQKAGMRRTTRQRERDKTSLKSRAEKVLRNHETNISIFGEEVMMVQCSYFPLFLTNPLLLSLSEGAKMSDRFWANTFCDFSFWGEKRIRRTTDHQKHDLVYSCIHVCEFVCMCATVCPGYTLNMNK